MLKKTTTTRIHQNIQPHIHTSFQRRTSASDTPLPAHIRTNLRAMFRVLTEPWDFSDYHGSKKTVIHDAQRLQRQWLGRSQKNLAKCIPTVAKICSPKKTFGMSNLEQETRKCKVQSPPFWRLHQQRAGSSAATPNVQDLGLCMTFS